MGWGDTLKSLWNTPSVDMSASLAEADMVEQIKEAMDDATEKRQEILNELLDKIAVRKAAALEGIENIKTIGYNKIEDESGNIYMVKNADGIMTIEALLAIEGIKKIDKKSNSILFDETDQMDYNNRYISLDAPIRSNDASDVAFMKITKNEAGYSKIIFPNFELYKQPGIAKNKYRQFIVTQFTTASQERMQIVEMPDSFQVLFFNKKPEFVTISGILKNTVDNPWSMNMVFLWDELMRGTKLVENGNILHLYIDRDLYIGYPFNFQRSQVAPNDYMVSFSFNMVVKEKILSMNNRIELSEEAQSISEYGEWGQNL